MIKLFNLHTMLNAIVLILSKHTNININLTFLSFQKTPEDCDTPGPFDPNQPARPFTLNTLNGPIQFPSEILPNNSNTPIIFHTFNNHSGFLESLWTDRASLRYLITESPSNTHYVFMSIGDSGYSDALWMRGQIKSAMRDLMDTGIIK